MPLSLEGLDERMPLGSEPANKMWEKHKEKESTKNKNSSSESDGFCSDLQSQKNVMEQTIDLKKREIVRIQNSDKRIHENGEKPVGMHMTTEWWIYRLEMMCVSEWAIDGGHDDRRTWR